MSRRTIPAAVACRQTATGPTVSASGAPSSNIALTATVKAIQDRKGSRRGYAAMEAKGGWKRQITPGLEAFISAQRSVFLATANRDGQPYIQHRAARPVFCGFSMRLRSASPTTPATNSSSAKGNWPKIRARTCS